MRTGDPTMTGVGMGPRVARGVVEELWKKYTFRPPDFGELAAPGRPFRAPGTAVVSPRTTLVSPRTALSEPRDDPFEPQDGRFEPQAAEIELRT